MKCSAPLRCHFGRQGRELIRLWQIWSSYSVNGATVSTRWTIAIWNEAAFAHSKWRHTNTIFKISDKNTFDPRTLTLSLKRTEHWETYPVILAGSHTSLNAESLRRFGNCMPGPRNCWTDAELLGWMWDALIGIDFRKIRKRMNTKMWIIIVCDVYI